MATSDQLITHEWVQITDGTKDQTIQFQGEISLCNSPVKPMPDAPALRFSNTTLTITKGDIAWV
ncbi:hypothetical protein FNN91_24510, partial [Salmonella enterica subsp. salamae]|nr:hypothetical protein [Salmonella enterica subsp. salamae]